MGYLKGKSSIMIFNKHANLKHKYRNRKCWIEGYYVGVAQFNESMISEDYYFKKYKNGFEFSNPFYKLIIHFPDVFLLLRQYQLLKLQS